MLTLEINAQTGAAPRTVRLDKRIVTIGARPDNDVVLEDPRVSGRHLTLELTERGLQLDDASTNGSFLRGERVRRGLLVQGEALTIAPFEIEVRWTLPSLAPEPALGELVRQARESATLQPLEVRGGALPGAITLRGVPLLLGASSKAECRLVHPLVSGRHAELTLAGGLLKLRDLGSTNGTFVNGNLVHLAFARPGDAVAFGPDVWFVLSAA